MCPATPHPATPHPAALPEDELLAGCEIRRTRGSGPGGQHRNKVETAIEIAHLETGVVGAASERREQGRNRANAVRRLRENLAVATRRPLADAPSPLWRSRCQKQRVVCSPAHDDFPALLAEALDALATFDWEPRAAAEFLGCTPSQLVKFVKLHPPAWRLLGEERARAGRAALR